jgi:Rieske Fe-S protein
VNIWRITGVVEKYDVSQREGEKVVFGPMKRTLVVLKYKFSNDTKLWFFFPYTEKTD